MILDTNLKLEAVLVAAVATTQPVYHVDYVDYNREGKETPPAQSRGALNSTTDVTLLAAPGDNNPRREVRGISIYNGDTAAVTVTIKTDDGTTERIRIKESLDPGESLQWQRGGEWQVVGPDSVSALGTEVASTSGTSIDFTGIPAWVTQIEINFVGVSTNGTSATLIQIGDSGGIETSGYLGGSTSLAVASVSSINSTAGFVFNISTASRIVHGTIILTLENAASFTWVESSALGMSSEAGTVTSGGSKSLSAALDRVRITTAGGTDAFDAGAINIRMT